MKPSSGAVWVLGGLWLGLMIFFWVSGAATFLPSPIETIQAFPNLWFTEGVGHELWVSFNLNLEATGIMVVLSLCLALSTAIKINCGRYKSLPLFRPLATLYSSGRFNGFVGLPLVFLTIFHNPHKVKVALLVFGMSVFTVMSLVHMMENIPGEQFDHSRTLRMSEFRVVWEVIVLGKFDEIIDIMRINIAMGWMMLPMVEGLFKFEGGIGAVMLNEEKHLNLDAVFCALFVILIVGLAQDAVIGWLKKMVCPYAFLGVEH